MDDLNQSHRRDDDFMYKYVGSDTIIMVMRMILINLPSDTTVRVVGAQALSIQENNNDDELNHDAIHSLTPSLPNANR